MKTWMGLILSPLLETDLDSDDRSALFCYEKHQFFGTCLIHICLLSTSYTAALFYASDRVNAPGSPALSVTSRLATAFGNLALSILLGQVLFLCIAFATMPRAQLTAKSNVRLYAARVFQVLWIGAFLG